MTFYDRFTKPVRTMLLSHLPLPFIRYIKELDCVDDYVAVHNYLESTFGKVGEVAERRLYVAYGHGWVAFCSRDNSAVFDIKASEQIDLMLRLKFNFDNIRSVTSVGQL